MLVAVSSNTGSRLSPHWSHPWRNNWSTTLGGHTFSCNPQLSRLWKSLPWGLSPQTGTRLITKVDSPFSGLWDEDSWIPSKYTEFELGKGPKNTNFKQIPHVTLSLGSRDRHFHEHWFKSKYDDHPASFLLYFLFLMEFF